MYNRILYKVVSRYVQLAPFVRPAIPHTQIYVCLHVYTIMNEFLVIMHIEGILGYEGTASKQDLNFLEQLLKC